MKHIIRCAASAVRHPMTALLGAREFRGGVGMSYDNYARSEAYDAGRELAHVVTFRRWDW